MNVWADTPYEKFYGEFMQSPTHRAAYFIALIDQTIADLFGVMPEVDEAPDEARQVAATIMHALMSGVDVNSAIASVHAIVDAWRRKAN